MDGDGWRTGTDDGDRDGQQGRTTGTDNRDGWQGWTTGTATGTSLDEDDRDEDDRDEDEDDRMIGMGTRGQPTGMGTVGTGGTGTTGMGWWRRGIGVKMGKMGTIRRMAGACNGNNRGEVLCHSNFKFWDAVIEVLSM
jgi:hypothetical protein